MWPTKDEVTEVLVKNITGYESIDDISDSFFIKHLIIALREIIGTFFAIAQSVYEGQTVKKSSGPDLDDLGFDFGVDRTQATKAQHMVTIKKSTPVVADTVVPDNFLLTTTPSAGISPVKFVVLPNQPKTIAVGDTEVTVLVECVEYGKIGNVDDGAINLVAQSGFDSACDSKIYKKAVEKESDESYRERILIRKRTPAKAGVIADYERWAREVPGVLKAKAFRIPRGPGTVDIVIWGADGGLPDSGLLASVQNYIDSVTPADIADGGVQVHAPEEVFIDVTISGVVVDSNTSADLEALLKEYFASEKTSLAVTYVDLIVTINKLFDNFKLVEPVNDIALTGRQAARLGVLQIL